MAAISMQAIRKDFGKTEVIQGVDFDIQDGEFTVFVGPSGCGKSTLLRLISGLEEVSSGCIYFDDIDVTDLAPAERAVAMVFQSYALYPHMNVYDNMAFGLKLAKADKRTISERVRAAAATLQIDHLLERKPKELSGGQRQRVAIGRAIVRQPKVFLFDEPLSNLDAALRVQTRLELKRLHHELGTTMIYVTHDQVEAMTLADRIVVLNGGKMEQVGSPLELYQTPCNEFVAGFIGSPKMNFLKATVLETNGKRLVLNVGHKQVVEAEVSDSASVDVNDCVTLGLRPEHITVAVNEGQMKGEVFAVEHLGSEAYVYIRHEAFGSLVFKAEGDTTLDVGQSVSVAVLPEMCYLFDQAGRAL
ncbi:ABC transporter ATP-binding protein [Pseudomaricurvus sp.]|uniref:ABC transporter ATP-binding protein n=1 Tax=Pseudomaricurvus sp. TaxID=2004510 RepID=UPI003F6D3C23